MNRCLAPALLGLSVLLPAHAQVVTREAPADVRPAEMGVLTPPQITIDGRPDQLSPGARIRSPQNLLVLPASLSGQAVPVLYRREPGGAVHEVWLLTADEAARLGSVRSNINADDRALREVLSAIFAARR
jgi:hypothetical protein